MPSYKDEHGIRSRSGDCRETLLAVVASDTLRAIATKQHSALNPSRKRPQNSPRACRLSELQRKIAQLDEGKFGLNGHTDEL